MSCVEIIKAFEYGIIVAYVHIHDWTVPRSARQGGGEEGRGLTCLCLGVYLYDHFQKTVRDGHETSIFDSIRT